MAKIIDRDEMYKILVQDVGVDQSAVNLIIALMGDVKHVYEDILFYFTGISDFKTYLDERG